MLKHILYENSLRKVIKILNQTSNYISPCVVHTYISTKICLKKKKKNYWLTLIFLALALIVDFCFSFDLFELIHFFIKNVLDLVWLVSLLYSWEIWFQRSDFCWSVAVGSSALNSLTNDSNVLILILPLKKEKNGYRGK